MNKTKAIIAGIFAVVLIVWIVVDPSRWKADFYPPDRSFVGPNLVAAIVQGVVILIVLTLVYPPFRRWIDGELHKVHSKVDESIKLSKHIIKHHPDIPNQDHTGKALVEEDK